VANVSAGWAATQGTGKKNISKTPALRGQGAMIPNSNYA